MMFERVLIAEDHESASISVRKTLEDLKIVGAQYVFYCDDALSRIQKGIKTGEHYDLLITDLSFEEDHQVQKIADGAALIRAVRALQPDLKVLIFSAESRPSVIVPLIEELKIDGYVRKARHDAQELKLAIEAIAAGKPHIPSFLRQHMRESNSYNFSKYDITIIRLLAEGVKQKDIPQYLQENKIVPAGLSSLEKKLSQIKEAYNFTTTEQLIAYCKDFKII